MADKLLQCPFCGGEVELVKQKSDKFEFVLVSCKNCDATIGIGGSDNEQKVTEAWNKRPNHWHTGTPTEDGWYLCAYDTDIYLANYWCGCGWLKQYRAEGIDCRQGLVAWQKIEPPREYDT